MADKKRTPTLARECIYTALLQLMEDKPYDQITIQDIVDRAGVSRMAYYRNYQTKDEILERHLDEVLAKYLPEDNGDQIDVLSLQFWKGFIQEFRNDSLIQAINKAGLSTTLLEHHEHFTRSIYGSYLKWNLNEPSVLIEAYYQMGGLIGTLMVAIDKPEIASVDVLASIVLKHLKHPVISNVKIR